MPRSFLSFFFPPLFLECMRWSHLFLFLISLFAIVVAVRFAHAAWYSHPVSSAEVVSFQISPNGWRDVPERLEEEGLIQSPFAFRWYARLSGNAKKIQTGIFTLRPGMSYAAIVGAFLYDEQPSEVQVTIPEGYTLAQIGTVVREKIPTITEEEWNAAVGVDSPFETHRFVLAAKKPDGVDLEGYLFPDTYRFFLDASAEDVVKKMLDGMETHVLSLSFSVNEELPTFHAMLTLASVVEREVRAPKEMADVADIFLKRLKIGMPLQADSTVNYVTGGKDASVSYADTELDSPYNTYKYPELPPGPISNPGMNALQAVMHPAQNAWYYFATDEEGKVYYAKTYDEHLRNVAAYVR